jgi:hypothetical protein
VSASDVRGDGASVRRERQGDEPGDQWGDGPRDGRGDQQGDGRRGSGLAAPVPAAESGASHPAVIDQAPSGPLDGTEPIRLGGPRRGRRRVLVAGGVVAAVAVGIGGLVWRGGGSDGNGTAGEPAPTATAEVTVRDLEERTDLEGTLGYGETTDVSLSAQGTITWLPAEGTVLQRGQAVVQVDDRVIPLLYGDLPLWRELGPDVEDGVDVETLERNLVDLGVATAAELTVDQHWTSATTDAVEQWQEGLGLEATGRVRPGDVVVQPGAVRVSDQLAALGGQPGGPVLAVAGTTRQVTIDLDATQQNLVSDGQAVGIELPDGTTTTGTISGIGTVAETPEGSEEDPTADTTPTIEVTIALDDPDAAGNLDEAPVVVSVVTSAAEAVTAVPVDALLALAEGGYAVERVGEGGATELVAVEVGAFADGWVEVAGDLAEGDDVVVPA